MSGLPEYIEIRLWSGQVGVHYSGFLPLSQMTRLQDVLETAGAGGTVRVNLELKQDDNGLCFLQGTLTGEFPLLCQRCLKPLAYVLNQPFLLGVVHSEEAIKDLPSHYDPLILQEKERRVFRDVVEDELILALPSICRHVSGCHLKQER